VLDHPRDLRAAVRLPRVISAAETRERCARPQRHRLARASHSVRRAAQTPARSTLEHGEEEAAEPRPGGGAPADRPMPAMTVAPAAEAASRQTVPDDTLRDIYARETAAHVATVRGYLAREAQLPEPHALPEDVYRALPHALRQLENGLRPATGFVWRSRWITGCAAPTAAGWGSGNEDLTLLAD